MPRARLLLLAAISGCAGATPDRDPQAALPSPTAVRADPAGPVVLELFTSQGCSSCPPADRLLSSLRRGGDLAGRPVIPLAFHVDYWNDLGWRDPFSSEQWSARQAWYARRLEGGGGVYTPALVIGGRSDAIGSHRDDIEQRIAATPPTADLEASVRREPAAMHVVASAPAGTDAWAAVVEDGVVTGVETGENAGKRLRNDHIVRALVRVAGPASRGEATIALDPAWHDVHVIVFAQDPRSGAIVAARALD